LTICVSDPLWKGLVFDDVATYGERLVLVVSDDVITCSVCERLVVVVSDDVTTCSVCERLVVVVDVPT